MAKSTKQVGRLVAAAICLACGTLASLLVAWTFAPLQPVPMYPRDTVRVFVADDRAWQVTEVHRTGVVNAWWMAVERHAQSPSEDAKKLLDRSRENSAGQPDKRVTESPPSWGTMHDLTRGPPDIGADTAFGWPLRCSWYQVTGKLSQNAKRVWQVDGDELHGGMFIKGELSSRGSDFRALPLRPIPVGIVVNTFFYAALIWLLLFGGLLLRSRIRRRRGQCPGCGYDLRGAGPQSPCPECGLYTGGA